MNGRISHTIANITNLQTILDGKASSNHNHDSIYAKLNHTHSISDITNLQTSLDGKQPKGDYAAASHSHLDYVTKSGNIHGGSPEYLKCTTSGFYRINHNTDVSDYGQMIVCHGDGDTIGQIVISYGNQTMFFRGSNTYNNSAGKWESWSKVISYPVYNPCKISSSGPGGECLWAW